MSKSILICGGGASGFFAAINIAEKHPDYRITILEKSNKILSKVRVSGGGRCNVTNGQYKPSELIKNYPRGEKKLYKTFESFSSKDMITWLKKRRVITKQEKDQRVFPTTNSSETIIECFLREVDKFGITIIMNEGMASIEPVDKKWQVITSKKNTFIVDKVVLATGASPAIWKYLKNLDLKVKDPVPSLFTFNIQDPRLSAMQGISFEHVETKVAKTKLKEEGPLLITHWGLSGPAILKLSAWGARELANIDYKFTLLVNFLPGHNFNSARDEFSRIIANQAKRKVIKYPQFEIPRRYWENLCHLIGISDELLFSDLGNKLINKFCEELTQANFQVTGKSTFKEEFVTCGGVALSEINLQTYESKKHPDLYFSGEVLDIDAITGGFNFQACWSSAWVISESI